MATELNTCLRREPGKLIVELHISAETKWSTNPDLDARLVEDRRMIARSLRAAMRKTKQKGSKARGLGLAAVELILALVTTRQKPKKVGHVTYDCLNGRPAFMLCDARKNQYFLKDTCP